MASFWDPVRYGWHVVYAAQIEGLPVLWSETLTGQAAAGYSEPVCDDGKGALVIDDSGEVGQLVDRQTGIGVGLPLTFRLRHCAQVETYLRRHVAEANLTGDLTYGAAVATVDTTSAFGGAGTTGVLYCETEAIAYTVLNATQFTLTARGLYGSIASSHSAATSARMLTDRPQWWRGRQVRLWAYLVTPSGYVLPDRSEVWRGHLSTGPDRVGTSWQFEALSIDRRLADDVLRPASGTVTTTAIRHPVKKAYNVYIEGLGRSNGVGFPSVFSFSVVLKPYAALADGTMLTLEEQLSYLQTAWAAAKLETKNGVTAAADLGTWLGDLTLLAVSSTTSIVCLTIVSSSVFTYWKVKVGTEDVAGETQKYGSVKLQLWYASGGLLSSPVTLAGGWPAGPGPAITLKLADAEVAPAAKGWLVDADGMAVWYEAADQDGAVCTFSDLRKLPGGVASTVPAAWTDGTTLQITAQTGDLQFGAFALTLLESSGDGNRGTYDDLPSGSGYGLDGSSSATNAISESSFAAFGGPGNALICNSPGIDRVSFESICGGMLAAQQAAVVPRVGTDGSVRLTLVDVSTAGGGYVGEITDADLLTTSDEPVQTIRRSDVPNVVTLVPTASGGVGEAGSISVVAAGQRRAQGQVELKLELPVDAIPANAAETWAASILQAAQTAQAIEIRIPPWLDYQPGDLLKLDLTHYGVWSWSSGSAGYTGPGRVLGCRMNLRTLARTLTILIDAVQSSSLSPAAVVLSADDTVAPTEVLLDRRYYWHMRRALDEAGAPVRLLHYIPGGGAESTGGYLMISDVTEDPVYAVCVVSSGTLGYDLVLGYSYLTLPLVAQCTSYQLAFSHDEDGSKWL